MAEGYNREQWGSAHCCSEHFPVVQAHQHQQHQRRVMPGAALYGGQQVLGGAAADDEGEVAGTRGSTGYYKAEKRHDKDVKDGDEAREVEDKLIKDDDQAVQFGDKTGKDGEELIKNDDQAVQGFGEGRKVDDDLMKDDDEAVQTGDEGLPRVPDGRWGWPIVLGCFIITLLVPVLATCFGVLFSRYLLEECASSSTTAWIFNTQCFTWNMMGIFVRPLAKEFGWRNVAIVGILLTSASIIISGFSPSPEFLFFSFSLLSGGGGGLVVCMSFILVPMYFDRHRGVANAIIMSGACIGQMVGPPLIRFLQDEYGFKGATLIIGAMMLNGLVGAAFFHRVEWHMKAPRLGTKELLQEGSAHLQEGSDHMIRKGVAKARKNGDEGMRWSEISLSGTDDKDESDALSRGSCVAAVRDDGPRYLSGCSHIASIDNMALSLSSLNSSGSVAAPASEARKTGIRGEGSKRLRSLAVLFMHVVRSTITDLGIFRSPRAVIMSFGCTLFINGYYNFIMMVPFAMQAEGHTLQDSALCISVSAVCNLLARMLMSSLSDWRRFNMRGAYMAGIFATATSIFVFPLLADLTWLMATMAVWGSGVGTTMGLYNLVMVRFMGRDNFAPVFGASSLTNGVGFLCIGPLIGVIRDASGSYAVSMWVLSGVVFTSFILWLFMPAAQAYDRRRRVKESEKESP